MTTITGAGMSAHYNTIAATRAQRTDPMKSVADTLGLTSDELKTELRSGRSLTDVAAGRNVEPDRLVAAVKEGLSKEVTPDATRVPEAVVGAGGAPHGSGAGRPSGLDDAAKAGRLSDLLKVDASKFGTATELVELMREKGVDLGQLKSILTSGDLLDVSM